MSAGGIIARFRHDSAGHLAFPPTQEYLQQDGPEPAWTGDRKEALFFFVHGDADERARELHAFALVTQKPIPWTREVRCNLPEEELPVPLIKREVTRRRQTTRKPRPPAVEAIDRGAFLRDRHAALERSGWA